MEKLVSMQSKGALEAWVYEVGEQYRVVVKRLGVKLSEYMSREKSNDILEQPYRESENYRYVIFNK